MFENSGDVALGFVEEEDYGALLVDEGVSYENKQVIDSDWSFHIYCEKEKSTKFSMCDGEYYFTK